MRDALGIFETEVQRRLRNPGRAKGAVNFRHVGYADLGRCLEYTRLSSA